MYGENEGIFGDGDEGIVRWGGRWEFNRKIRGVDYRIICDVTAINLYTIRSRCIFIYHVPSLNLCTTAHRPVEIYKSLTLQFISPICTAYLQQIFNIHDWAGGEQAVIISIHTAEYNGLRIYWQVGHNQLLFSDIRFNATYIECDC